MVVDIENEHVIVYGDDDGAYGMSVGAAKLG